MLSWLLPKELTEAEKKEQRRAKIDKAFGHVLPVKSSEVLAASPKVKVLERVLAAEPVLQSLRSEAPPRLTGFPSETAAPLHVTKAELADPTVLNGVIPEAQDKAMFAAAVGLVEAQRIEREVKEAQKAAAEAAEARVKALRKFIREREAAEAALSKAEHHVRGATKKKRSSVLHILSRHQHPRHSLANASRYAHLATINEAAEKEALGVALARVEQLQAASAAAAQTVAEAKVQVAAASAGDFKPKSASKSAKSTSPKSKSPKPSPIPEPVPAEKKRSFLQRAHKAIFGTAQRKFLGRALNRIPGYRRDRTYKNLAKHFSNRFWNMQDNEGVMRSRFGRALKRAHRFVTRKK